MKLIKKWKDFNLKVENRRYVFKNGLELIHSINPKSIEFNFSIVCAGGSAFETEIGVPHGTAHFLEHVMFGNPNDYIPDKDKFDGFVFGTKYRAGFSANASTSFKYIYFYGNGNKKASKRILRYFWGIINFPDSKIQDYIEKERGIILGELERYNKEDRDPDLQYERKFISKYYSYRGERVIGTKDSIKKISVNDLIKYKNAIISSENLILTIQSPTILDEQELKLVERYSNIKKSGRKHRINKVNVEQEFDYDHFKEENMSGVFISIGFYYSLPEEIEYKENKMTILLNSFFWQINHQFLREEQQLIYGADTYDVTFGIDQKIRGFKFTCDRDNLIKTLNASYDAIYNRVEDFFNSEYGKTWFNNIISNHIFRSNEVIIDDYAERFGVEALDNSPYMYYDYKKGNKALKELQIEELKLFIQKFLNKSKPRIWFVSPYDKEEILNDFKKSKFYYV